MLKFNYETAKEYDEGATLRLEFKIGTQYTSSSHDDHVQQTIILGPGNHDHITAPMEVRDFTVDYLKTLFDRTAYIGGHTTNDDGDIITDHDIVDELTQKYLPARDSTGKKVLIEYDAIEFASQVGKSEVDWDKILR